MIPPLGHIVDRLDVRVSDLAADASITGDLTYPDETTVLPRDLVVTVYSDGERLGYSRDEWDEIVEIGPDNGLIARLRAAAEWRRDAR